MPTWLCLPRGREARLFVYGNDSHPHYNAAMSRRVETQDPQLHFQPDLWSQWLGVPVGLAG